MLTMIKYVEKYRYFTKFPELFCRENALLFNCLKTDLLRVVEIDAHSDNPGKEFIISSCKVIEKDNSRQN